MAAGSTNRQSHPLREVSRASGKVAPCPTSHNSNPLASFVLHMMHHNFVNPHRQRSAATQVTIGGGLSVREMDDIVEVIEEWEGDGSTSNRT